MSADAINIEQAISQRLDEVARLKALRVELRTLQRDAARVEAGRPPRIPDAEFARRFEEARKAAAAFGLGWISLTASSINVI